MGHLPVSASDLSSPSQLALTAGANHHMSNNAEYSLGSFLSTAPYDAGIQERLSALAPSPLPATSTVTHVNHGVVQAASTAALSMNNHYTMQNMPVTTQAPINDPNMLLQQIQTNAASFEIQQQQSVHPLDAAPPLSWSMNNLEAATVSKVKMESPPVDPFSAPPSQHLQQHQPFGPLRVGPFQRSASLTFHPMSQVGTVPSVESPEMAFSRFPYNSSSPTTPMARELSSSSVDCSPYDRFETCDEPPIQYIPRHSSVGCIYPVSQSRELLEHSLGSSDMHKIDGSAGWKPGPPGHVNVANKPRRASLSPDGTNKVFTCANEDCRRTFKRSEHLKRHVRSVHTLEKPFACHYRDCPKRFSRSDNLNQHIRIHRHDKDKAPPKPFNNFTPFFPSANKNE
ncbi:hypothetical protein BGW42_000983 [Actinomortierella wolfii]|nr:hypothetical protein BGW42_000983 [Actinomortierella wolfii]